MIRYIIRAELELLSLQKKMFEFYELPFVYEDPGIRNGMDTLGLDATVDAFPSPWTVGLDAG